MALATSHPDFQESPRPQVTPSHTEVSLHQAGFRANSTASRQGTGREDKAFLYSYFPSIWSLSIKHVYHSEAIFQHFN